MVTKGCEAGVPTLADWEAALLEVHAAAGPIDWDRVGATSFRRAGLESAFGEWVDSREELSRLIEHYEVGSLWLDFVESLHGDVQSVSIYRLPGGTALAWGQRLWTETDGERVIPGGDIDQVLAVAMAMLAEVQGASEWPGLGPWDDLEWLAKEGDTILRGGVLDLRRAW